MNEAGYTLKEFYCSNSNRTGKITANKLNDCGVCEYLNK